MSTKPFKVCLMGASLNTGNRDVSSPCASFVKIVKHMKPNAGITLLTGNRDSIPQTLQLSDREAVLRVVNHRMSPRARPSQPLLVIFSLACLQKCIVITALRRKIISSNTFLRELHECDFVGEIRGGDSFSDIYGLNLFLFGSLTSIIVLLLGKQLVLLPLFEQKGKKVGKDFFLVYSPEPEDPVNKNFTTRTIPKVVDGVTPSCRKLGQRLYGHRYLEGDRCRSLLI